MKWLACLAFTVPLLAQTGPDAPRTVRGVRHWPLADVTRLAIEVSGEFTFRSERLHNPERVFFDVANARPRIAGRKTFEEAVESGVLKRIRVAETRPGVTRIVLELGDAVDVSSSRLANPHRLIVELRPRISNNARSEGSAGTTQAVKAETGAAVPPMPREAAPPAAEPSRREKPPAASETARREPAPTEPAPVRREQPPAAGEPGTATTHPIPASAVAQPAAIPAAVKSAAARPPAEVVAEPSKAQLGSAPTASSTTPAEIGAAAKRTSSGGNSLVRALGLKISRIVIDPGHGGQDQGTEGPKGLLEKEVVLDAALRLGKLVQERMGAEVVYTRMDDTYVPLEARTALANENKADLFLSIHANASSRSQIAGVETFYLNVTGTKDALDVAARENASSQKSVFELGELIQKIAKQDKADESREFAQRIQAALYAHSARNVAGARNRGVKSAPFVVLIGANMPSVLAEIGFLSNPKEEALMKKADYRQKLAEALYRGLSRYAESLSHFQQVARTPATGGGAR